MFFQFHYFSLNRDSFNECDLIATGSLGISQISSRGAENELGLGTAKKFVIPTFLVG